MSSPSLALPRHTLTPLALAAVFYHVGQCMGIQVIPDTLQELAAWSEAYERKAMVFAPQNNTVAVKTVELLLWHVPEFARPPLFHVICEYNVVVFITLG